jgi:integrase
MATFRQRGGRWQAIIRRVDLKASKSFDRKVDAVAWARAREREADLAGTLPGKMAGTLAAVIDRYEREIWPDKRWGASKANELAVLRRDLGARLLADLSRVGILAYVRGLDIAAGGVSSRLSYLREVLRTAHELWAVPVPLAELDAAIGAARRMKLAGKSQARIRRPTEAELAAIIAYDEARNTGAIIELAPIVRVLAVLPLRVGELLNIEWSDLDAARRSAVIRSRKHPDIRVKERNNQEVPLIAFRGVDTFALINDRPRYLPSPFPYKRNSVSTAFAMAALRCQIVNLHIHDLRAHALSSLLEAGVPIPQVALISGHKNWKVLARHYARIDPASVHDAVKRASP